MGGELRARGSRGQELGARRGQGSQPGGDDLPISRPPLGSGHFFGGEGGANGPVLAPSQPAAAPQSPGRRVSGRRTLPSHCKTLSPLVCPILRGVGGQILQLPVPRCLQWDDGQDTLPAGGCCLSSQPWRCWRKAANYSSLFNDFWTCSFVTCCLAPFSRCLLGYLCIQVRQSGSGDTVRLQAASPAVAVPLVPVRG